MMLNILIIIQIAFLHIYIQPWVFAEISEEQHYIRVKRTSPDPEEDFNSKPLSAFSCDFDINYCGWKNDSAAEFNWTRTNDETPSTDTGPPWDHTTRKRRQGSYLFVEASSPREEGDKARLISPLLESSGTYCLGFWHHMHGADIKDLNVLVRDVVSKKITTISHLSGAWSVEGGAQTRARAVEINEDWWNEHQTEFTTTGPAYILIEGVRGENYRGDIALDDVTLTASPCVEKPINCDFENNTCGWTQMSGDDFNWLPQRGTTETSRTGPLNDHTYGTPDGRYLFIEASWPRAEGDRARLISPLIRCTVDAQPIFRFWYNMHGEAIGPLRVYLTANETSTLGEPVWQLIGEQGQNWIQAHVVIPENFLENHEKFYIVIEAERKSYRGDTAIDDITLIGCFPNTTFYDEIAKSSTAKRETTTSRPFLLTRSTFPSTDVENMSLPDDLSCNFDDQTICGWNRDSGDFDWTLNRGKTHSLRTGPVFDHTTRSGWYIYTEASAPRVRGHKALLRTPPISASIRVCVRFYYHMYGESMGRLEVLTARIGRSRFNHKWSANGQQSVNETDWRFAEVDVTESFNYELILRGTRGVNFHSDIAVDDISVTPSPCGARPLQSTVTSKISMPTDSSNTNLTLEKSGIGDDINCNFDHHSICQWVQIQNDHFDWTVSRTGKTPSPNTGPTKDHTSEVGEFAYIEASKPRQTDDSARLESPIVTLPMPSCFSLWYHMYGIDTGSLAIYSTMLNSTASQELLWKKEGNVGNSWQFVQVNLKSAGDARIMIEANRGSSWKSDIAIDDIKLEAGECPIFNCTFDTGFCGWYQDETNDDFNWERLNTDTPTTNTGPKHDHTRQDSEGHYIFIETSSPREQGDKVRLFSPTVDPENKPKKCLTFWYHSFGTHIGEINVYKKSLDHLGAYLGSPLWYQGEDEGDQWLYASINVEDDHPYQIVLEGVRGISFRGDIAIDDVSISNEPCQPCCGDKYFKCGNHFCIPSSSRCNGVNDCEDDSDESSCQDCGITHFTPVTSPSFGRSTPLGQIQIVDTPLGAHRFNSLQNTTNIPSIFAKLLPAQVERMPIPSGLSFSILDQPSTGIRSEKRIIPGRGLQLPSEIFHERKRRSSHTPNATNSSNISALAKNLLNFVRNDKASNGSLLHILRKLMRRKAQKALKRRQQLLRLKNKATNHSENVTFKKPPKSPKNKRYPAGMRGAERISSWQFRMMRKSRNRDREEEEKEGKRESEGIIERMKRSVVLKITGGSETRPHSWPWQAAYYVIDSATSSHYFCGGTLIDRYWIVTAAHCPQLGDTHVVVVGDHDLYGNEGTEQELKVEAAYVNQAYHLFEDLEGDIALVKLRYPARTTNAVQPACLLQENDERFQPGDVCVTTGWGRTDADADGVETILRQGEVPIVEHETCQRIFSSIYEIHDSMVCAGATGANSCRGDSGGPLICKRNNRFYLVGITSWGDIKCKLDIPGVYTRVQSYMTWLERIIQRDNTCNSS